MSGGAVGFEVAESCVALWGFGRADRGREQVTPRSVYVCLRPEGPCIIDAVDSVLSVEHREWLAR